MKELPFVSMYVDERRAYLDFHGTSHIKCINPDFFEKDDGRFAIDHTTEELENILKQVGWNFIRWSLGYTPSGSIDVKERFDKKFNVMIYDAYFSRTLSASFK